MLMVKNKTIGVLYKYKIDSKRKAGSTGKEKIYNNKMARPSKRHNNYNLNPHLIPYVGLTQRGTYRIKL